MEGINILGANMEGINILGANKRKKEDEDGNTYYFFAINTSNLFLKFAYP